MGVSTSLAVIKTITQLKRFAWLSKGLFDDLNPNQKHLVLLLTVWRLIIVYVITPVNVGFKKYKEDKDLFFTMKCNFSKTPAKQKCFCIQGNY